MGPDCINMATDSHADRKKQDGPGFVGSLGAHGLDLGAEANPVMACPQCELGGLRCDDAMLSVRHQLGTQEPPANSRHGRQAEWNQKCRIWNRVRMLPTEAPRCVHGSVDTEARINRAWIQLAHSTRAAATEESSATQKREQR
jgi:hypothetical protein